AMKLWRKIGIFVGGLLVLEAGARVGIPSLNGQALTAFLRGGSTWVLTLYDRFGGGGLSRGGVLALGIMPYLSARILMLLAGRASPALEAMAHDQHGRRSLARWTRILTVGLSLVQSYGFARFVQGIPGAVVNP